MIKEKLNVLLSASVIDQTVADHVLIVVEYLLSTNIIRDELQADAFLTHLTMAINRQRTNEVIDTIDAFIRDEIVNNEHYEEAKRVCSELLAMISVEFQDAELDYIHLHLSNLLRDE